MKNTFLSLFISIGLLAALVGCAQHKAIQPLSTPTLAPAPTPKIARRPATQGYGRGKLDAIGTFDPSSGDPFAVDLRSYDLTDLDLSQAADQLRYATFDDRTTWPSANKLPAGFDWKKIMEVSKNPGLGVRGMHDQGITGRGVGIAIIDQPLQVDHPEYHDQLRLYEEINVADDMPAQMHGPAVASLAVGKTVGVAPGADLYFLADWWVDPDNQVNFTYLAQGIERVLEINRNLPEGRKIRVISISRGYMPENRGYDELMTALQDAEKQGLAVFSVDMIGSSSKVIAALGRDPLADPDAVASYTVAAFLVARLGQFAIGGDQLWVPIDSRTTASPTGQKDYAYYGVGGMSWVEPYLAGVYALACQVAPQMTPDRFWKLAVETGSYNTVTVNGESIKIGPIINPPGLIQKLKS
jgi:subtilisin family serine protease